MARAHCFTSTAVLGITVVICGVFIGMPLVASEDRQRQDTSSSDRTADRSGWLSTLPERRIAFTTIAGGQLSGFGRYCDAPLVTPMADPDLEPCVASVAQPALAAVIRDVCAWESLWNEHTSIMWPHPPAPEVDFDRDVIVAVVAGPRPNGCYGTAITQIVDRGGVRLIHVVEGVPCEDDTCTMNITNPFHFISVPRESLPPGAPVGFANRFSS